MNPRLLAVIVTTILLMAFIFTGAGGSTVALMIALLLVYVLPGYALVKALFPGTQLENSEFIALTLGLSLAITAIGGLVIYWLGWELNTNTWTIFLGSVTVIAGAVALLRYQHLERPNPAHARVNFTLSLTDILLFLLAASGVVIAFAIAYQGEIVQNNSDFTQLWMLPDEASASDAVIGINNRADEEAQYRLEIVVDGRVITKVEMIELQSTETWEYVFTVPENAITVTANLYRWYAPAEECSKSPAPEICDKNEEVYREVVLRNWVRK